MNKLNLIPVDVYQTSLVNNDNYIYTFYIKDYKHVSNKAKAIYKHHKKQTYNNMLHNKLSFYFYKLSDMQFNLEQLETFIH